MPWRSAVRGHVLVVAGAGTVAAMTLVGGQVGRLDGILLAALYPALLGWCGGATDWNRGTTLRRLL